MKIGLYYCPCGIDDLGEIPGTIKIDELEKQLVGTNNISYFKKLNFVCSEDGQKALEDDLKLEKPDRVIMTVCSVQEHEATFRKVLQRANINPYYLQLVNVREHVAWVTDNTDDSTNKAIRYLRSAAMRVQLHEPLENKFQDVSTDVLVIGAGPAGLKAALTAAEAGRHVTLVEKSTILGGLPVRFEEVFPKMECGPCMLEPILGQVLHSDIGHNITLALGSEVIEVTGFFGNFLIKIRKSPRYVSIDTCVGCGACMSACPVSGPNPLNMGRTEKKAIDVEFFGGLPNVPFIDSSLCTRFKGEDCTVCRDSCPVENTIQYDDQETVKEIRAGAIIVAVGASLYDCSKFPNLGWGNMPDVYNSFEFERILAANGPTGGQVQTREGKTPERIAIIHCVGSLDPNHHEYCSSICCMAAFKYNHLITHKSPETKISHFYKTIVAPGKIEYKAYNHCLHNQNSNFVQYHDIQDLNVTLETNGRKTLTYKNGTVSKETYDMIVLMPAVVASESMKNLSVVTEMTQGEDGFFEELHERTDATKSKIKGIYIAGACQSPMDMQSTMIQGVASSGLALSTLVPGRQLVIDPIKASVIESRCSACHTCEPVCPYKAILFNAKRDVVEINAVLCTGCGTCVAACPSGAIKGNHFTNDEIYAEIEELLK